MSEPIREMRIALVLYGGVSLAIYENGVVRCFWDLVKGSGIFKPLLELLDAEAMVDVVAGTSAGGINGLMLAAALENGTDFSDTANLWRRHGDFGRLLRDVDRADQAISLLDGEGYYQKHLVEAFEKLCQGTNSQGSRTGEMDVFITGTDLDGRILQYWDDLNQEIRDKTHRTVFHLKHRPGRKWLGLTGKKTHSDAGLQALILGSIARITGTFPIAFPPFCLGQIPVESREKVGAALSLAAGRPKGITEKNSFIDGGVLDNKPFSHVLRAIFYRMPSRIVDRHLFYVEPDPDPYIEGPPDPARHTPLKIFKDAITTIPSHESIFGDLETLRKHNDRIAWLNRIESQMTGPDVNMENHILYRQTRIESLARALLLKDDVAPSASDRIRDQERGSLLRSAGEAMKVLADEEGLEPIDALDVDYHLRIVFRVLYDYSDELREKASLSQEVGGEPTALEIRTVMRLLGRIVKALKLIRDVMYYIRDDLVAEGLAAGPEPGDVIAHIHRRFLVFLDKDAPQWRPMAEEAIRTIDLSAMVGDEESFLPKDLLTTVLQKAYAAAGQKPEPEALPREDTVTILTVLGTVAHSLVLTLEGSDSRHERACSVDRLLYPIQFTSGIHELDRIRLTRISPRDAQKGLSRGTLQDKVTGEDFAHFSAFLRRDWRSNDILRGRLDGICQIFRTLFDRTTMNRLKSDPQRLLTLFTPEALKAALPDCPDQQTSELLKASQRLVDHWAPPHSGGTSEAGPLEAEEQGFVDALILATQYDAFLSDVQKVGEDVGYQDTFWGKRESPDGVTSESTEQSIELAAAKAASAGMADKDPKSLWDWFCLIGPQKVLGQQGAIPYNILGEYVTRAYLLLWGMLSMSLGDRKGFLKGKVRHIFRTPVRLLHEILTMLRRQTQFAALSIAAIVAASLAVLVISLIFHHWVWLLVSLIFLLVFIFLLPRMAPDVQKRNVKETLLIALISGAITVVVGFVVWLFAAGLKGGH